MEKMLITYCVSPAGRYLSMSLLLWGLAQGLQRSIATRRLDWVPQMRTSWATPLPRRVYARTQKKCPHLSICTDVKQVRALMSGINYYRNSLPDLSQRLRLINSLLRRRVRFAFTPGMEKLVREILVELATPPILVLPNWDAVAAGSRPFHVYCDACIDGFGAALEQEQGDGCIKPIAYISRATLDSERHGTPLDLEAGSIVWALKRLRGYLWGTKFRIFSDHKAVESIGNVGNHNGRVQRWLGVHHRVRLHARVPQRKRERQRRLPVPLTRACHGT